jgi:hypothetical protein
MKGAAARFGRRVFYFSCESGHFWEGSRFGPRSCLAGLIVGENYLELDKRLVAIIDWATAKRLSRPRQLALGRQGRRMARAFPIGRPPFKSAPLVTGLRIE